MTAEIAALRFRVDVACMGYAALTDDDVPQDYIGTELDAYKAGCERDPNRTGRQGDERPARRGRGDALDGRV